VIVSNELPAQICTRPFNKCQKKKIKNRHIEFRKGGRKHVTSLRSFECPTSKSSHKKSTDPPLILHVEPAEKNGMERAASSARLFSWRLRGERKEKALRRQKAISVSKKGEGGQTWLGTQYDLDVYKEKERRGGTDCARWNSLVRPAGNRSQG